MRQQLLFTLQDEKVRFSMRTLERIGVWLEKKEEALPMSYVKSQWQKQDRSVLYLLFRLLVFLWFAQTVTTSIIFFIPQYWLIYLTHWMITVCFIQSLLGLTLVALNQANRFSQTGGRYQNVFCQIYGWLHTCACAMAFGVTILYWSAVFNPDNTPVTFINVDNHLMNSVLMLLDLYMVSFPAKFLHMILAYAIGMTYILFSLIYYFAGGRTAKGDWRIYPFLDWQNASITAPLAVFGTPVFVVVITTMVWAMSLSRRSIHDKCSSTQQQPRAELEQV